MPDEQDFQSLFNTYASRDRTEGASGCAALFSPGAELFPPFGLPAAGRTAIAAAHLDGFEDTAEQKSIKVVRKGSSGDLGCCLSQYGEADQGQGTCLNVPERQADGNWPIPRCSLNEMPDAGRIEP